MKFFTLILKKKKNYVMSFKDEMVISLMITSYG